MTKYLTHLPDESFLEFVAVNGIRQSFCNQNFEGNSYRFNCVGYYECDLNHTILLSLPFNGKHYLPVCVRDVGKSSLQAVVMVDDGKTEILRYHNLTTEQFDDLRNSRVIIIGTKGYHQDYIQFVNEKEAAYLRSKNP